jgi:hypothetical protein
MVCSKDPENINIKMDDDALKQVPKFKYLLVCFFVPIPCIIEYIKTDQQMH